LKNRRTDKKTVKNSVKKPKKTKRYNGVYDPEFEHVAETVMVNEMTGAVPFAPGPVDDDGILEN
jgi:hypothetical protein